MVSGAVTLITLLAEALMVLLCLHTAFGKKFKFDWATVGIVLVDIVLFMLVNLRYIPQVYAVIILYILIGISSVLRFKTSMGKTLVLLVVSFTTSSLLEVVVHYVIAQIGIIKNVNLNSLVASILALSIAIVIYRIFCGRIKSIKITKSLIYTMIFGGFTYSAMFVEYYQYSSDINLYFVIILTLLLIGYFYLYALEQAQSVIERKALERELQDVYGETYQELLNEVRRKQHDFKNQMGALRSMALVAGSMEELIDMQNEYSKELTKDNKFDSVLLNCNNPILAGYIYSRCSSCEMQGIEVDYNIKVDQATCDWGIHELIEVVGILLDNACEELYMNEYQERIVSFAFIEGEKQMEIGISNPSKEMSISEIERLFDKGYSTKGENRGLGLTRVLELVNKYNDLIETSNKSVNNRNWIDFRIIINK